MEGHMSRQNLHQYIEIEYWETFFMQKGFIREFAHGSNSWNIHIKNSFGIGYSPETLRNKKRPTFFVAYGPAAVLWTFNYELIDEFMMFIDAICEPDMLALCLGYPWLSNVLDAYFRGCKNDNALEFDFLLRRALEKAGHFDPLMPGIKARI
jgi:hypothetical protein